MVWPRGNQKGVRKIVRGVRQKEYDLSHRENCFGASESSAGIGPVGERNAHGSNAQVCVANDSSFSSGRRRVDHPARTSCPRGSLKNAVDDLANVKNSLF